MNSCDDFIPVRALPAWADALSLMQRALALLDESCCAPEIGAHLDLAATRLEERMLQLGLPLAFDAALIVEPL